MSAETRAAIVAKSGGWTANELAAIKAATPRFAATYAFLNRPYLAMGNKASTTPKPTADQVLADHGISWGYQRSHVRLCDIYGEVIDRGMIVVGRLDRGVREVGVGRYHLPPDLNDKVAKLLLAGQHKQEIAITLQVSITTVYRRIAIMKQAGTIQQ
jgi:hypothetical protein